MKLEIKPMVQATIWVGLGLAITLAAIWLAKGFVAYPTPDNVPTRWDHYRYIAISRQPFGSTLAREAPYCWRILTPLLVYFSPLEWHWSFMLLTLLGIGGVALTLYFYLQKSGYAYKDGVFGLALFFSLSGLSFNLRDFYLSDPLALLAIALAFYLLLSLANPAPKQGAQVWWLLGVLVLGVLAKETVLALLPLIVFKRELNWPYKLLLCFAPILVVIGLRLAFPSSNAYSYVGEMSDVLAHKFFGEGVISLLMRLNFAFLGTWGPALVLLFYRPRDTLTYLIARKTELIFLAIIYGQILIAHNVDRLLVYGLMVVIPLLVHKAVLLCQERQLNLFGLGTVILSLQLLYFYSRPPLWVSLLICGWLVVWLLRPFQFYSRFKTAN